MRDLSQRIEIRLSEGDTARVRLIAERSGRSVAEVLRHVIRAIDPERVTTGIPLPTQPQAEASERELSVA